VPPKVADPVNAGTLPQLNWRALLTFGTLAGFTGGHERFYLWKELGGDGGAGAA
jgi:hypothetical protein